MKKVCFSERSLYIHVVSQFYMMEAVSPSPWSNFKLFTLVQYLNDLFSAAVSSTTLYHVALCTLYIKYPPGKTNPHFLSLMSPDKTSCNFTNFKCLDSEFKCMKIS